MKKNIYTFIISASFVTLVFPQAGTLDPSFGSGGIVTTAVGSSHDYGNFLTLQPDQKILVTGYSDNGTNYDFSLVRYNADGSLDNSFGAGGKVITPLGSYDDWGYSVAVQTDGKILVAGENYSGTDYDFAIVRYDSNGSLDNSFGTGGISNTSWGSSDDYGYSVKVQIDGKIVLAGFLQDSAGYDFAITRYNNDGSIDTSFGNNGKTRTTIGSGDDLGWASAIQANGKILVAGYTSNLSDFDFALVRYNIDGSLDNTFGSGGKVVTAIGSGNDYGYSVMIQPDGKILVSGDSENGSNYDFAMVRYNIDGSLDNTFGTSGKVVTPVGVSDDKSFSVAIQGDGKILAAGFSSNTLDHDFALVRYKSDGIPDTSFGSGGTVITPIGNDDDDAISMALQADGKIVVGGTTDNGSDMDFAVVRYNNDLTGVYENSLKINLKFHPNPTTGLVYISTSAELKNACFKVVDLAGKVCIQRENACGNSFVLDMTGWKNGIYFLEISDQPGKAKIKFVKN